jgi:hypothetical protein
VQESVFYVPKPPIGCIQNAKLLFKKKKTSVMIAPFYNGKEAGMD